MSELVLLCNEQNVDCDSVAYYCNGAVIKHTETYESNSFSDQSYESNTITNESYTSTSYNDLEY